MPSPSSPKPRMMTIASFGLVASLFASVVAASFTSPGIGDVCRQIANEVSDASRVAYPGDTQYAKDAGHWATSSSQNATCTVEPGTPRDVGIILQIVGCHRTPFAVKGGGHTTNPGFSSTTGVLIAMSRFSQVVYQPDSETAVVGAGLIWDDVYAALAPHNVSVAGGRVSGVGVAGFTLGGGYSWHTNQVGLSSDTVAAFELVKPDGVVVNVSHESDPDLFFGLRGGGNNFGIVTSFTFKAFSQGLVWGGVSAYSSAHFANLTAAVARFSEEVTDPKASVIASYSFIVGKPLMTMLMFYDGPTPPPGIFDSFLDIPADMSNLKTRDYLGLVQSSGPDTGTGGHRALFRGVPLTTYTPKLLETIFNESLYWASALAPKSVVFGTYGIEPFLSSILSHSHLPSAYPPDRARAYSPFNIFFAWEDAQYDTVFYEAAEESARRIAAAAQADGQDIRHAARYPNYATYDTPLTNIYGGNIRRLRELKRRVDPENVMGLTGGFRF